MKTVDMETEYELGQKMIDALVKEKVQSGLVQILSKLTVIFWIICIDIVIQ